MDGYGTSKIDLKDPVCPFRGSFHACIMGYLITITFST